MRSFSLYIVFTIALISQLYSQVGIGTVSPEESLHLKGTFRLVDGTQGTDKVLTTDANGTASWQDYSIKNSLATLGSGVNIPANQYDYLQTGTTITLPPGTWAVTVNMVMTTTTGSATPRRTSAWLRSSFSDSPGFPGVITADILGSDFASGNFLGATKNGSLYGLIIINNSSGADKTYYYIAGRITAYGGPSYTIDSFGGNAGSENSIVAYKIY